MDFWNLILFAVAAIVLLGSPGPAIAALVAVGQRSGFVGGLSFYGGLQVGLASAAAICALGLYSLLETLPWATIAMTIVATSYLIYLSYKIATSPVGKGGDDKSSGFTAAASGGFLIGITNPKAYVAFVSIMASYLIVPQNPMFDVALKWLICVVVMIVVDAIWLWLGDVIRKANLSLSAQKTLNRVMGLTILLTAILAWL